MYDLVDTLYNRLAITMLVRPWDFGWFAAMRAYHRCRMFQEVATSDKKQLEMGKDFFKRVSEANINNSKAKKPPMTFDECW